MSEPPPPTAFPQPADAARGGGGARGTAHIPAVAVELPCRPKAGGLAREAVLRLADDLHPETLARVRLLVTELVVAAVPARGAEALSLSVELRGGLVRADLTLVQADAGTRPTPGRGWGRFLLDRIADRWQAFDGGVWFELAARPARFTRRRAEAG